MLKKNLLALAALLIPLGAAAQTPFPPPPPRAISGPYVGAFLGASQAKSGCLGILSGGGRACDDTDPAFGAFAGYRFGRYLGAELGYDDLGKVRAVSATRTETTHATVFELTALAVLPLTERFSAYGKFGGYHASLESSERGVEDHNNGGLTYGAALQWDFSGNWSTRLQWQRYKDVGAEGSPYGVNTYDTLGAGILWRWY